MRKVSSIEGLRGILALWVVFGHTLASAGLGQNWRGPFKVLAFGGHAVDVFIIVSGFVIFYLLDSARESYGRFMWRRFLRLYPVYLICLIASALLLPLDAEVYRHAPWPHPMNVNRIAIAEASLAFLPQHLLAHLTMAHGLIPDSILKFANYGILGQAWSLSLEWQFYAIAPVLFLAINNGEKTTLIIILFVSLTYFLIAGNEGFLPRHIPMFTLGVTSFLVWRRGPIEGWPLLMPAGVALAYLVTGEPAVTIWTTVFLSFLSPRSLGAGIVRGFFESRPMQLLGHLSYSIYLTHSVVLLLSMALFERAGAQIIGQWPYFFLLLSMTCVGTLVSSTVLYKLVEVPCIEIGRRRRAYAQNPHGARTE